jgi:hypothetical protein
MTRWGTRSHARRVGLGNVHPDRGIGHLKQQLILCVDRPSFILLQVRRIPVAVRTVTSSQQVFASAVSDSLTW